MRRIAAIALIIGFAAAGCATGAGPADRVVRVDFRNDEFASYYWRFFPHTVAARPGDTIVFEQEWTGEPHTVTLGTLVDKLSRDLEALEPELDELESDPSPAPERLEAAEGKVAAVTADVPGVNSFGTIEQNWAQPCYLETGTPPKDADTPCADADRRQPAFDGRQTFYNSGFIAPEGPEGNTFRVELADDIAPGEYRFVCTIHMPFMQGVLDVRPKDADVPDASATNARVRSEVEELAAPLRRAFSDAQKGAATTRSGRIALPMAGYHAGDEFTVGVSEFVPRRVETKVGEKVTWTVVGPHTISFDVPRYLPIFVVDPDGTVRRNPKVDAAAGGPPQPPPADFENEKPVDVDGGTWDGDGFLSSGLIASEPYGKFSLRFSKAGSYRFACLVHPPMVGTVVVSD